MQENWILAEKLKEKQSLFIDLDYRKKFTKIIFNEKTFKDFNEFNQLKEEYMSENGSIIVPSFNVDDPPNFFMSEEFKSEISKLHAEFDYVICDTPPWDLFVDAKIVSRHFDHYIYIVCNQLSSFRDIDLFEKDIKNNGSISFFYNKFSLYFNFLWYKYQYPYYSRNYYYDYISYSSFKTNSNFSNFLVKSAVNFVNKLIKWVREFIK